MPGTQPEFLHNLPTQFRFPRVFVSMHTELYMQLCVYVWGVCITQYSFSDIRGRCGHDRFPGLWYSPLGIYSMLGYPPWFPPGVHETY